MEVGPVSMRKKLGITSPPILVALAAIMSVFGIGAGVTFYPFALIGVIGIFILGVSIVVAWVSAKSFMLTGSVNLLILGVAVLEFGSLSILGGLVTAGNAASGALLYLIGLLAAGALHLVSAGLTYFGSPQQKGNLRRRVGVVYGASIVLMIGLSSWAAESSVPQVALVVTRLFLGSSAVLFISSSILFSRVYKRSHSSTIFWYSLGLATTAFSLTALLFAKATGDLGTWTGIGGVLLGSLYFLVAVLAASNAMSPKGVGLGGNQ